MDKLIEILLPIILAIESGGNFNAVGDGGKALGAYQIHAAYWSDGCGFLGVHWDYKTATDPERSKAVVRAYLTHYGKLYERETGKKATAEVLAAIHCSGPKGGQKLKTNKNVQKYVQKIKDELKRQGKDNDRNMETN